MKPLSRILSVLLIPALLLTSVDAHALSGIKGSSRVRANLALFQSEALTGAVEFLLHPFQRSNFKIRRTASVQMSGMSTHGQAAAEFNRLVQEGKWKEARQQVVDAAPVEEQTPFFSPVWDAVWQTLSNNDYLLPLTFELFKADVTSLYNRGAHRERFLAAHPKVLVNRKWKKVTPKYRALLETFFDAMIDRMLQTYWDAFTQMPIYSFPPAEEDSDLTSPAIGPRLFRPSLLSIAMKVVLATQPSEQLLPGVAHALAVAAGDLCGIEFHRDYNDRHYATYIPVAMLPPDHPSNQLLSAVLGIPHLDKDEDILAVRQVILGPQSGSDLRTIAPLQRIHRDLSHVSAEFDSDQRYVRSSLRQLCAEFATALSHLRFGSLIAMFLKRTEGAIDRGEGIAYSHMPLIQSLWNTYVVEPDGPLCVVDFTAGDTRALFADAQVVHEKNPEARFIAADLYMHLWQVEDDRGRVGIFDTQGHLLQLWSEKNSGTRLSAEGPDAAGVLALWPVRTTLGDRLERIDFVHPTVTTALAENPGTWFQYAQNDLRNRPYEWAAPLQAVHGTVDVALAINSLTEELYGEKESLRILRHMGTSLRDGGHLIIGNYADFMEDSPRTVVFQRQGDRLVNVMCVGEFENQPWYRNEEIALDAYSRDTALDEAVRFATSARHPKDVIGDALELGPDALHANLRASLPADFGETAARLLDGLGYLMMSALVPVHPWVTIEENVFEVTVPLANGRVELEGHRIRRYSGLDWGGEFEDAIVEFVGIMWNFYERLPIESTMAQAWIGPLRRLVSVKAIRDSLEVDEHGRGLLADIENVNRLPVMPRTVITLEAIRAVVKETVAAVMPCVDVFVTGSFFFLSEEDGRIDPFLLTYIMYDLDLTIVVPGRSSKESRALFHSHSLGVHIQQALRDRLGLVHAIDFVISEAVDSAGYALNLAEDLYEVYTMVFDAEPSIDYLFKREPALKKITRYLQIEYLFGDGEQYTAVREQLKRGVDPETLWEAIEVSARIGVLNTQISTLTAEKIARRILQKIGKSTASREPAEPREGTPGYLVMPAAGGVSWFSNPLGWLTLGVMLFYGWGLTDLRKERLPADPETSAHAMASLSRLPANFYARGHVVLFALLIGLGAVFSGNPDAWPMIAAATSSVAFVMTRNAFAQIKGLKRFIEDYSGRLRGFLGEDFKETMAAVKNKGMSYVRVGERHVFESDIKAVGYQWYWKNGRLTNGVVFWLEEPYALRIVGFFLPFAFHIVQTEDWRPWKEIFKKKIEILRLSMRQRAPEFGPQSGWEPVPVPIDPPRSVRRSA